MKWKKPHIHESHSMVKDKPWSEICRRCAIRANDHEIKHRCAANANYPPEPYDGPMWSDAEPWPDEEDENVKHLIRGQRVSWAEYDEAIDFDKVDLNVHRLLIDPGMPRVNFENPKRFVTNEAIESMTYWVRTYFLESLDKVEERNGKTVWPSQSEATESAIRGAIEMGIHGEITFKIDYDISDGLDCVLIEWRTK